MKKKAILYRDPEILGGMPMFTGTRVPVQALIDRLKAGETLDDFLAGFSSVRREQAEAFLDVALSSATAGGRDARAA